MGSVIMFFFNSKIMNFAGFKTKRFRELVYDTAISNITLNETTKLWHSVVLIKLRSP